MFIQKDDLSFEDLEIGSLFYFQNEIYQPYFERCQKIKSDVFISERIGQYNVYLASVIKMKTKVVYEK